MKIDALSAAFGAIGVGVVLGMVSLTSPQQTQFLSRQVPVHVVADDMPAPRHMVQIKDGTPFTVPPGKLFVLTGLGGVQVSDHTMSLLVDGVEELQQKSVNPGGESETTSVKSVPPGFSVKAGATIEVVSQYSIDARAWGYLIDV